MPKFNRQPIKRTLDMISKDKRLVDWKNLASRRHILKETILALSTINKIIHQDLSKDTRKKSDVHYLTDRHKKTHMTNCRKLYEKHLAGHKSEFVVTLDEALIYDYETNRYT